MLMLIILQKPQSSMEGVSLKSIFPELSQLIQNPLQLSQFSSLPYFQKYWPYLGEKQCRMKAQKSIGAFRLIKVKKGTVLYAFDQIADQGFIVLSGCIQILARKNNREKTQIFPGHVAATLQEKSAFLSDKFKVDRNNVELLSNIFYEDKILFKYLPFRTVLAKDELGFGEIMRNTLRTQTAVSTAQSALLVIDKNSFDHLLRDFHAKKDSFHVNNLLNSIVKNDDVREMIPKMSQIMNSASILSLQSGDILYKEGDYSSGIYFIIQGQLEVQKSEVLEVPKKYLKNQNALPLKRQVLIKVAKIGRNSIIGEDQIFSSKKFRNFKVVCSLNETLLLKIDHNLFSKVVGEFVNLQKILTSNAVYKRTLAFDSFQKQLKKVKISFLKQYEQYDSKKKEQMLSNFLQDFDGKNQLFEVYAPEGIFFRDTFQKLQGFDQSQKEIHKKQSIRRLKVKNNAFEKRSEMNNILKTKTIEKIDPTQKLLFSPGKKISAFEFFRVNSDGVQMAQSVLLRQNLMNTKQQETKKNKYVSNSVKKIQGFSPSVKQYKSMGKFHQIEKDEEVYKKVLIKNGLYPKQRKTDKTNIAKPLIHRNFDEIVKQCVTRKNQSIKRTNKEKQSEIILDNYQRTVSNINFSSLPNGEVLRLSRFSTLCKGTDQMRKRMQSTNHLYSGRVNQMLKHNKKGMEVPQLCECIGVNVKPKSSEFSRVISADKSSKQHKTPTLEKIVLLNHMMKPITYFNSTEL